MTDILDRIRKLLARTTDRGCTEGEASAAFAKATSLLAEHNLDMKDINLSSDGETSELFFEKDVFDTGRWLYSHQAALDIIRQFCFVQGYFYTSPGKVRNRRKLYLFGTKSNVDTAQWMFNALIGAFERLFYDYRLKTGCLLSDKNTYLTGVKYGFIDKMQYERGKSSASRDEDKQLVAGDTALAIRSVEDNLLLRYKQAHPDLKTTTVTHKGGTGTNSTRSAGYQAGQKLNLNRALSGKSQGRLS